MYGDGAFKYTHHSLHRSSSSKGISFILGAGPIESAVEDAKEKVKNEYLQNLETLTVMWGEK